MPFGSRDVTAPHLEWSDSLNLHFWGAWIGIFKPNVLVLQCSILRIHPSSSAVFSINAINVQSVVDDGSRQVNMIDASSISVDIDVKINANNSSQQLLPDVREICGEFFNFQQAHRALKAVFALSNSDSCWIRIWIHWQIEWSGIHRCCRTWRHCYSFTFAILKSLPISLANPRQNWIRYICKSGFGSSDRIRPKIAFTPANSRNVHRFKKTLLPQT